MNIFSHWSTVCRFCHTYLVSVLFHNCLTAACHGSVISPSDCVMKRNSDAMDGHLTVLDHCNELPLQLGYTQV